MKYLFISLVLCLPYLSCQKKQDLTVAESPLKIESELSDVLIEGVDFEAAESIASILKNVNIVRGEQSVTLTLDSTRKLNIVESYNFLGCPVVFLVGKDGIRMSNSIAKMSRDEFIVRLKALSEVAKAGGHDKFPLVVRFDNAVSGEKGHQILKDLCDNGMILMFRREDTREERALKLKQRLEEKLKRKPTTPNSMRDIIKSAEQVVAPDGE